MPGSSFFLDWDALVAAIPDPPWTTVYMGTPQIAVPALSGLLDLPEFDVTAVVSQPDRPAGRGRKMTKPPVAGAALDAGVRLLQPEALKDARSELESLVPQLIVVMAYGRILPRWLLSLPALGPYNLHASLLPAYRGAAPLNAAIRNGDQWSGISLMGMEPEMDAGPVFFQHKLELANDETVGTLHDRTALLGRRVIVELAARLQGVGWGYHPQDDSKATFAPKIEAMDRAVDWTLDAREVDRQVRSLTPVPGARSRLGSDWIRIHQGRPLPDPVTADPGTIIAASADGIDVACGDGRYRIVVLQMPGRKAQPVAEFLRGADAGIGRRFDRPSD